jgi:hypothetical protein
VFPVLVACRHRKRQKSGAGGLSPAGLVFNMTKDDLAKLKDAVAYIMAGRDLIKAVDALNADRKTKTFLGNARSCCNIAIGWLSDIPGMDSTAKE